MLRHAPVWFVLLAACQPDEDDTGDSGDSGDEVVPAIDEALDCGTLGEVGGIGAGTDLQRLDLDPAVFPDALCNDGTPAFFYFRPYEGEPNRDRWVIQLQGGGSCNNPEDCFARWCSVDTNFGMQGMTATASPAGGIRGDGVIARREDNPVGDFNHVFIRYCSSDAWAGRARDVVLTGPHPVTDEEVTARLQFTGANNVDAVLATLRQDGVAGPSFTLGGGSVALPDLDDAEMVVLAGSSAGGAGTIWNGDRVGDLLREHNTACQGATCDLDYALIVDSIVGPSFEHYDYSASTLCTEGGLCSYEAAQTALRETGAFAMQSAIDDASCVSFHASDGDAWKCTDYGHVVRNHVTTPMVVRMGQTDPLISGFPMDLGMLYEGEAMDLVTFALLVRQDMAAIADPANAEEGTSMTKAPAVFSPTCPKHETLSNDASVFDVTIDVDGTPTDMFALVVDWRLGSDPAVAIALSLADDVCENE